VLVVVVGVVGVVVLGVVLVTTALFSSADEPPPPHPERASNANDIVRIAKDEGCLLRIMVLGIHMLVRGCDDGILKKICGGNMKKSSQCLHNFRSQ
jgi:hypothetical protein